MWRYRGIVETFKNDSGRYIVVCEFVKKRVTRSFHFKFHDKPTPDQIRQVAMNHVVNLNEDEARVRAELPMTRPQAMMAAVASPSSWIARLLFWIRAFWRRS